jgi:uncharacterized repeat protein (TIGR01451 family)
MATNRWVASNVVALTCVAGWAPGAWAQGETGNVCVRDFRGGAVCTANDVRIEELIVIAVIETCLEGVPGETEVVFEALVSSAGSPDRFDIGLFLALDGGSARDGDSCYHDNLDPPLTTAPTYGDVNFDMVDDILDGPWWDGDMDMCGDLESNTQALKTLPSLRFACIDNNGDGSVDVGVCTSWDNNTNTICTDLGDAFPGTNSKCSCDAVELGIAPAAPAMTLVKTGVFNDESADSVAQVGETITYSFLVTNTGTTALTNVSVTDPMVAPITCPSGNPIPSLGVGADETCTGTYTLVQADVDAGQKVNVATADSTETAPVNGGTTVPLPAGVPALPLGALTLLAVLLTVLGVRLSRTRRSSI